MTERTVILLGRHGIAPQKPEGGSEDWLKPESFTNLYQQGRELAGLAREIGATPATTSVRHTNKQRTKDTALARLSGMYGVHPAPQSREELAAIPTFHDLDVQADERFAIGKCSLVGYVNLGVVGLLNHYLAHPEATVIEGEATETPASMFARNREGIAAYVNHVLHQRTRLGNVISHASCIELPVMALVNTGRITPVDKIEQIGGGFKMEEYGTLTIDTSKGGLHTAKLNVKGVNHSVDLTRLL